MRKEEGVQQQWGEGNEKIVGHGYKVQCIREILVLG